MTRSGRPLRLADGIYQHATAIRVVARAGKRSRETRFPIGSDLAEMQRWQLRTKADLLEAAPSTQPLGTLAGDVPRFLGTMPDGSTKRRDYETLLQHWTNSPLGAMRRDEIRQADIRTQLAAWERAGVAVSTRNHRLRAIKMLYDVLDGDNEQARNPAQKIRKTREPEPQSRGVEYALIDALLAALPEQRRPRVLTSARAAEIQTAARQPGANRSAIARTFGVSETTVRKLAQRRTPLSSRDTPAKTRARFMVIAFTGLPPAQIMRLTPEDVNLEARTVRVLPRRKGKGVTARTLPLWSRALEAFKAFAAAEAWGTYSTTSAARAWAIAKRRVLSQLKATKPAVPADEVRRVEAILRTMAPYDLRHSFATELLKRSGDLKAVKELLMHGDLRTTERYVGAAVKQVAQSAIRALEAAHSGPASVAPRRKAVNRIR